MKDYIWNPIMPIPDETYQVVFDQMVEERGMQDYNIKLSLNNYGPATKMYADEPSRDIAPVIYMPKYSQELNFRTDVVHELEHIRTNWEEIRKVGTDNFKGLVRKEIYPESVAFRGVAEYMSWKAECRYNSQDKRNTGIVKKCRGVNEREWQHECVDSIAAYKAYYDVHTNEGMEIFKRDDKSYYEVGKLISDYANLWPLSMRQLKELGKIVVKKLEKV